MFDRTYRVWRESCLIAGIVFDRSSRSNFLRFKRNMPLPAYDRQAQGKLTFRAPLNFGFMPP